MNETASFTIQSYVDVKTLAQVLLVFDKQELEAKGASDVVRKCLEAIGETSSIKVNSVEEALAVIASHGISMKQLSHRGAGIRNALQLEDITLSKAETDSRANEIAAFLEKQED